MSDHIGEPNAMICPHCGLPADRQQNGIQGYRCGSSFAEAFKPQWARSMTCLELQNGQLQDRIKRLEEAGDELMHESDDDANINRWLDAKEDKP